MHGHILEAFDEFSRADAGLRQSIEGHAAGLRASTRGRADDGSPLARKDALVAAAEAVVRAAERGDAHALETSLLEYTGALERAKQVGARAEDGAKIFWWEPFLHEANDFLAAGKRRARRLRDGDRYTDMDRQMLKGGGGWMVTGSPADLQRMYERLVAAATNVRRF
jgi:hypothetical protein